MNSLRITEIFYSLQGEASTVGYPTVFVRLTGCPLRCGYCDTAYAFQGGESLTLDRILETVGSFSARYVTVTGGEPMAQKACPELVQKLCDRGYEVSIETSGSIDITPVDARASVVMDLKTPASGEVDKNLYSNIEQLEFKDQVKFVISDRADYDWAREKLAEHQLDKKCAVLFSPVADTLRPSDLADWIIEDNLPVRFQIQLHKILWGDQPGR